MPQQETVKTLLEPQLVCLPDYNEVDIQALLGQLDICSKALKQLLDGQITLADYLDILEFFGMDMEDYASITDSNLVLFGI